MFAIILITHKEYLKLPEMNFNDISPAQTPMKTAWMVKKQSL